MPALSAATGGLVRPRSCPLGCASTSIHLPRLTGHTSPPRGPGCRCGAERHTRSHPPHPRWWIRWLGGGDIPIKQIEDLPTTEPRLACIDAARGMLERRGRESSKAIASSPVLNDERSACACQRAPLTDAQGAFADEGNR